jgi:polyisoprenoid-binding protein YceI
MKINARLLFLALPLSLAATAFAQHETFTVSPDASHIGFALNGTGHHVEGVFHVQDGTIQFDPAAQTISGSIVAAANSGNSGDTGRDKKMNSEVLNSDKFTEIIFAPKSYTGKLAATGDSTIQVSGVFTLHGSSHDITVPMQVHIAGSSLEAKGQFVVPYVKWGLKDPSIFILKVAKQVDIDLDLKGGITPAS